MGARLLGRSGIVAAGGYGLPVRRRHPVRLVVSLLAVSCLAVAGCGGGGGRSERGSFCERLGAADEAAFRFSALDPADPGAYATARDEAVAAYLERLSQLRKEAPSSLRPDIGRMETAVRESRYEDAVTARGPIDTYAQKECPNRRVYEVPTSTTSTTVPATTTTVPARRQTTPTTVAARTQTTPTTVRTTTPTTRRAAPAPGSTP